MGITAIFTYTIPNYPLGNAVSIIRMVLVILASVMAYVGAIIGGILLMGHWVSLNPLGVFFLAPFSPFVWEDWRDYIVRVKWIRMRSTAPKKREQDDQCKAWQMGMGCLSAGRILFERLLGICRP